MVEIYKYLQENAENVVLRVQQKELWIQLMNIYISIKYEEMSDEYDNPFFEDSEIDWNLLKNERVCGVSICCSGALFDEENQEESLNYSLSGLRIVKELCSRFEGSVIGYHVGDYIIDESAMCGDVWNYGVCIDISLAYQMNALFYEFVLEELDEKIGRGMHAIDCDLKDERVESFHVSIIGTNTKCRRLGYLKLLVKMIGEKTQVPQARMLADFERYCKEYKNELCTHQNDKGVILETKTGNSALPYVEVAQSLGLVQKNNNYYVLGKMGKVYEVLMQTHWEEKIFELGDYDKLLLSELLLRKDYLYLSTLLELLFIYYGKPYQKIKDTFRMAILMKLESLIETAREYDKDSVLSLKTIKQRIEKWQKPEIYLDHILLPRLNWLLDMGWVAQLNGNVYEMQLLGKHVLVTLMSWQDTHRHILANVDGALSKAGGDMLGMTMDERGDMVPFSIEMHKKLMVKYVDESFEWFKTMAPNRVTYSQCEAYVCSKLLVEHSVCLEKDQFYSLFDSGAMDEYLFKYQSFYKDGYIQKKQ